MLPIQLGLTEADLLVATTVLYVLLPRRRCRSLPSWLGKVALLAGLVSHVPSGLRMFDSLVLAVATYKPWRF